MKLPRTRRTAAMLLCLVGVAAVGPRASGAQSASPVHAAPRSTSSGGSVWAGVGAVAGTIVYAPFKALVLCPVSAVAAGVTYAITLGSTDTSDFLLRLGCTGTYVVSPTMVQGEADFRQYDER